LDLQKATDRFLFDMIEKTSSPQDSRNLVWSRILALVAIAVWLASLSQIGLVVDDGTGIPKPEPGYRILTQGWMGAIAFWLAWFANPLFLVSVSALLMSGRSTAILAIVSALFAVDMFRYTQIPGGGRGDIYAYGPGAFLWLASMAILCIASGLRQAELKWGKVSLPAIFGTPLAIGGISAFAFATASYTHNTTQDRTGASVTELKYLAPGSVKRGPVCKEVVSPPSAILNLDGPLEILGRGYPLDKVSMYLSWGIPVVRSSGFDFSLVDPKDMNTVFATSSKGPAAARVVLKESDGPNRATGEKHLQATLTSGDNATVAFDQRWSKEGPTRRAFCPDLIDHPRSPAHPPQSLFASALKVPGGIAATTNENLGPALGGPFLRLAPMRVLGWTGGSQKSSEEGIAGCSSNVKFVAADPALHTYGWSQGQSLQIGDRKFFILNNQPLSAVCDGDHVYLYYFWLENSQKTFTLFLQKRPLSDFTQMWTATTVVDYQRKETFKGKPDVWIRSATERDGELLVDLVDAEQRQTVQLATSVQRQ
jgi:hypothetical protein